MPEQIPKGIVQGLSKKKLKQILFDHELNSSDFGLLKFSELKTIKNISFVKSDKHLDEPDKPKDKSDKSKKDSSSDSKIEAVAHFPWDIFIIDAEIFLLLGIAALLIVIFFFFWVFITVPLILLVLGFLSLGDAWRMLRVYTVRFRPGIEINMAKVIRSIHSEGGIISKNWRNRIVNIGLRIQADKIRNNYVRFMRSVCVTSYSLFILATLLSIEYIFEPFGKDFTLFFWLFFGILALLGFSISILSLIERRKLRSRVLVKQKSDR